MSTTFRMVDDPAEVMAQVQDLQESAGDGLLQLTASSVDRCVVAGVSRYADQFGLRTVLVRPCRRRTTVGVARGDLDDLPAEVTAVLDGIRTRFQVPDDPLPTDDVGPILVEDALLLADRLRAGDQEQVAEVLTLIGRPATPPWLRDLAFGARLRLTACLLRRRSAEILSDLVVTDLGWGRLDLETAGLHYTGLPIGAVCDELESACRRWMSATRSTQEVC